MKKNCIKILLLLLLLIYILSPICFADSSDNININAEACILMDYNSRKNYL